MRSEMLRVGLIVPSSNTVMEPDLHQALGDSCAISTSRTMLEETTREAETRMLREELPRSMKLIATTDPHVTVFGCTSAGSLGGVAHDMEIAEHIERETGGKGITVIASVLAQLQKLQIRRLAVFTPYVNELTESVAGCLSGGDYELVKVAGMGILKNRDIGAVTPREIEQFVAPHMEGVEADCIFLSCTNWQAIGAIAPMCERYSIPVISSNQATIDTVRDFVAEGAGITIKSSEM